MQGFWLLSTHFLVFLGTLIFDIAKNLEHKNVQICSADPN
jgi:hypothetical protein